MSGRVRVADVLETFLTVTEVPAVLRLVADLDEHIPEWGLAEVCVLGLDGVYQLDHRGDVVGHVLLDLEVLLFVEHSSVVEGGALAGVWLDASLVSPAGCIVVDDAVQGLEDGGLVVDLGLDDVADHAEDTEVDLDSADDREHEGKRGIEDVVELGVLPDSRCDHVVEDRHVGGEDGCSGWP